MAVLVAFVNYSDAGEVKTVTSELKVTGVVRDKAGNPVEAATIKVCPMGHRNVTSDSAGRFEITWNPRHWGEETVCYLVIRHLERNLAAAIEIEEDIKTVDVKLDQGVTFIGKVVDAKGKAIGGAKINVMMRASLWGSPITDWQRGGAIADAKGKFEVKAIPPEHKYNVQASAEGYGKKSVEVHADDAEDNRLDAGQFSLALANLSLSGVVVDGNDKPMAGVNIYAYGVGQPDRHNIQTDTQGKFTIEKVCAGKIRLSANVRGKNRLHGNVETEGGATDVTIIVTERGSGRRRFVPKQPPSLVGKPLPEFAGLKLQIDPNQIENKMLLMCFWDMQQRPSRHFIRELTKQAEQFKEKGVIVAAVQASKIDENALNDWVKKYKVPFSIGTIEGDDEKTHFAWGVKSLPWLILTDEKHIIQAEGFGLNEIDEKMKAMTEK
jgi:protocatechuate 3,4-dioxygenase beta subunit